VKEKQTQNRKHDEQLYKNDHPQRFANRHTAESCRIKAENLSENQHVTKRPISHI
jgi:hypothetical protein